MVLRDTLNPALVQLGAAHPNPALTATSKLNRLLASIARKMGDDSGLYDLPPGCQALRIQIAQRAVSSGCHLTPGDIVTTSGCSEAISLCLRAVCRPGDTVALESPICFDTLQALEVMGLQALEIATHPRDGISLEALRFAIDHNPVQACLVISNLNNPLGSCIPDASKRALVGLLAERDMPLIENRIFGEIYFDNQRPAGGFLLWIQLPDAVDSLELYKFALKTGIALTSGHIFSATDRYHNFIRLIAANWSGAAERAIEQLGGLIAELL